MLGVGCCPARLVGMRACAPIARAACSVVGGASTTRSLVHCATATSSPLSLASVTVHRAVHRSARRHLSLAHAPRSISSESVATPASPPAAQLLDGLATSSAVLAALADQVAAARDAGHRAPGLAVLLTTTSRDSHRYVQRKGAVARSLGFVSTTHEFDETTVTREQLIQRIHELNEDPTVDGILVQLPLPPHLSDAEPAILSAVLPRKDVDGFHPDNMGHLAARAARNGFDVEDAAQALDSTPNAPLIHHVPCTPKACMELIDRYNISLTGKHVAVLGRSATVGLPLTLLLLERRATVSNVDHTFDKSRARALCAEADVLIAAVGHAEYIRSGWVKPGAVIIDVGINFVPKTKALTGHAAQLENPLDARDNIRLVGDVHFAECASKAAFISPVPGGVGPMTVAMLMQNTLRSYAHTCQQKPA